MVSNEHVYAVVASMQICVQVPAPAGLRWKATDWTPMASVAVAVRFLVPVIGVPGSARATAGAVLSTRRPATVAEVVWFPAPSRAIARRS